MATSINDRQAYMIVNAQTKTMLNVLNNGGAGTQVVGATTTYWNPQANSVWVAGKQGDNWSFLCPATQTYLTYGNNSNNLSTSAQADQYSIWNVFSGHVTYGPAFFRLWNTNSNLNAYLFNGDGANAAKVICQQETGQMDPNLSWVFIPVNFTS